MVVSTLPQKWLTNEVAWWKSHVMSEPFSFLLLYLKWKAGRQVKRQAAEWLMVWDFFFFFLGKTQVS